MNILMVTPDYPPVFGGIGIHVSKIAENLVNQGHNVTILVLRINRGGLPVDNFEINKKGNLTVVKFPSNNDINFRDIDDFDYDKHRSAILPFKIMKANLEVFEDVYNYVNNLKEKFDIIHAHDAYNSLISVSLKRILNLPLVTTLHALSTTKFNIIDSARRYIMNNSNSVITISNWSKTQILKTFGPIDADQYVIHNGVDFNLDNIKKNINIGSEFIITFSGRLIPIKGCQTLIHSIYKVIHDIDPEIKLKVRVIGDGSYTDELKQLVTKLKLDNYIDFLGKKPQSELIRELKSSNLHVVPSLADNFPIAILEAMAEGVPIISTDIGGIGEMLINNSGILISPDNSDQLAHEIVNLIRNKDKQLQLIINGYKRVRDFSWENIARQTHNIYKKTIISYPQQLINENNQRRALSNYKTD